MGIFKIVTKISDNQNIYYVSYYISSANNEITLYVIDLLKDQYYYQLLNYESSAIRKWAQNLQQTPEEYISQLCIALKEQCTNTEDKSETRGKKEVALQNIFELDEESNLIWKQFFEVKKIFGRKGKFSLIKKSKDEALKALLSNLMNELHGKEISLFRFETENKKLTKEHEDLRSIAESSVTMKENFEREIYGKFSSLLNTKKRKNLELRTRLLNNEDSVAGTSSAISSSVDEAGLKRKDDSEAEYDNDTDLDSPDEVEDLGDDVPSSSSSTLLKRKGKTNVTEHSNKKSKDSSNLDAFSQDFLNDSLEAELNVGSFSRNSFRRKFKK